MMERQELSSVYPHWRGEHSNYESGRNTPAGLSPLARGTLLASAGSGRAPRFIPASAGNTKTKSQITKNITVYPRWRGEHFFNAITQFYKGGLSPLARGTHPLLQRSDQTRRFIPAGAGNTVQLLTHRLHTTVYPRWRGEHRRNCK